MKKLIFTLVGAVMALGASAITVDEAYQKVIGLPGAAISDVPEFQHIKTDKGRLKDELDWGKVVMFIGATPQVKQQINDIVAEITDELVLDKMAQGNNPVKGYARKDGEKTHAFVIVEMANGSIVLYGEGGDDVIERLSIN